MNKLITILLTLILAVVSLNLLLTLTSYSDKSEKAPVASQEIAVVSALYAKQLGKDVVELYNKKDFEGLYDRFDDQAKVKLDKEEFKIQFLNLYKLFGEVSDYAYMNKMKIGEKQHEQYYQLFFSARVSNKNVGKAKLILSVIVSGDDVNLYGVRLNANQTHNES